jgi:hypothetical protein
MSAEVTPEHGMSWICEDCGISEHGYGNEDDAWFGAHSHNALYHGAAA